MKREFGTVGLGGTFDQLHKGHRALLMRAFELGDHVLIGLCTDAFARKLQKTHETAPYEDRMTELTSFLSKMGLLHRSQIVPLEDAFGPAISGNEQEAIVVSKETEAVAHSINKVRAQGGLPPLEVIVIDMIPAENHVAISTTRIRHGEIDREGHLLSE